MKALLYLLAKKGNWRKNPQKLISCSKKKYCKFNSQKLKSTLFNLDCLQSAFSLKILLVLISSSVIANHDVIITNKGLRPRVFRFACSNFAKKNRRLLGVYFNFMGSCHRQNCNEILKLVWMFFPIFLRKSAAFCALFHWALDNLCMVWVS